MTNTRAEGLGGAGSEAWALLTARPDTTELRRRAELIQLSRKPDWLFSIAKRTERSLQWCTFRQPPSVSSVLLFTSQPAAKDYIRHTKVDYQSVAMKVEDVPRNAANWSSAGLTGFALNRCPRCNFIQTVGIQTLQDSRSLHTAWSLALAMQHWRAQKLVQLYLKDMETPKARAHLEFLRDHVDCGNPYVHQLIALKARMENDKSATEHSLERLGEFGSEFTLSVLDGHTDGKALEREWTDCFVRAEGRLLASYGVRNNLEG
jgi:hypothetical protein